MENPCVGEQGWGFSQAYDMPKMELHYGVYGGV